MKPPAVRVRFGSHAIYNALIGYLLVHLEEQDLGGLLFFAVVMGVHFLVNDTGPRRDHKVTDQRLLSAPWPVGVVFGNRAGLGFGVGHPNQRRFG